MASLAQSVVGSSRALLTRRRLDERLHYGFSLLHCLPVGMWGENPAGTDTLMRPDAVRRYAAEAGFARV
jgi:hypothetical protein